MPVFPSLLPVLQPQSAAFYVPRCSRFPFFNVRLSSDQVPCLLNPPTNVLSSEAAKPHTAKEQHHVF